MRSGEAVRKPVGVAVCILICALVSGVLAQDKKEDTSQEKKESEKKEVEVKEPDVKKLALLRIEIPEFEKIYYREVGKWPSEGTKVRVDIHKLEEPFDLYPLACPKMVANAKATEKALGIKSTILMGDIAFKEADEVERDYHPIFEFRNEWSMLEGYSSGEIARVALWPGRYTISFSIVNSQGGSMSGILPTVKQELKPGQYDIKPK